MYGLAAVSSSIVNQNGELYVWWWYGMQLVRQCRWGVCL